MHLGASDVTIAWSGAYLSEGLTIMAGPAKKSAAAKALHDLIESYISTEEVKEEL
jgi:hypothetical protein